MFPGSKQGKVEQLLVSLFPTCGTHSLNTWGLLKPISEFKPGLKTLLSFHIIRVMIWLSLITYFESAIVYLLLLFLSFKRHSKHFLMSCWNACLCPCKELQIPCVWMVIYKQNMLPVWKVKGFQLEHMLPMTEMHSNTITSCKANWTDRTDQFCKDLKRTIVRGRYRNNLISILQTSLLPKIKQINKYMKLTFLDRIIY